MRTVSPCAYASSTSEKRESPETRASAPPMFEHVLAFSHRHSYEMPAEFRLDLEIHVVVERARRDAE